VGTGVDGDTDVMTYRLQSSDAGLLSGCMKLALIAYAHDTKHGLVVHASAKLSNNDSEADVDLKSESGWISAFGCDLTEDMNK
jgi:hypothetical protein